MVGWVCNPAGFNLITNNNEFNKRRFSVYVINSIPITIKPDETFLHNGIESIFAELTTTNGVIVVGLINKCCVDTGTENISIVLEPIVSSLDPRIKTYVIGYFNITCWTFQHHLKILEIKI